MSEPHGSGAHGSGALFCCGGLRVDTLITAQGQVRLAEMGGNAIYSAAGARLWQAQVGLLARVGDNYPHAWLGALAQLGFDVRGVRNVGGAQDHRTFYAYLDNDTRDDTNPAAHFARAGQPLPEWLRDYVHSTTGQEELDAYPPLAVTPEDLAGLVNPGDCLHIAPISVRTQTHLPAAARAAGARLVSVDPSEQLMRPAMRTHVGAILAQVDVFMPSDMEVRNLLGGVLSHETALHWFVDQGPAVALIKRGSAGVLVHARAGGFWEVPALDVKVIDVTGAGDAFCGGFIAAMSHGGTPVEAAICGTVSASFAIEDYGAGALLRAEKREALKRAAWLRERVAAR